MPRKYKYCSVKGCRSFEKISTRDGNINFHLFPRDTQRLEQWKLFCGEKSLEQLATDNLQRHYSICSLHFRQDDYVVGNKKLKQTAIPSLNKHTTITKSRKRPASGDIQDVHNHQKKTKINQSEDILPSPSSMTSPLQSVPPQMHVSTPSNENAPIIECTTYSTLLNENFDCKNVHSRSNSSCNYKAKSLILANLNMTRKRELMASPRKTFLFGYAKKKERALKRLSKKYAQKQNHTLSLRDICCLKPDDLKDITSLSQKISSSTLTLLVSQLKCAKRKPKGRRWTLEEKTMALSLYKKGPKVYRLLRCMFTLPGRVTLNSMLHSIPLSTGINEVMFSTLTSTVSQMEDCDKHCVLLFDEMYISEQLLYDTSLDRIVGVEDHGDQGRSSELANHALVFMVCGLLKKWKQPVAFYFSTKKGVSSRIVVEHIKTVISACTKAGLHVLATLCDMGSTFVKAVKKLGSTTKHPVFSLEGRDIITLFDPPHLIKCTRNMLQKHNVKFQVKTGSLNFEGEASWRHIQEAYNRDKKAGTYRWLLKLTDDHVNPTFKKKMKVKLATQVLSHSVAAAIMKDVSLGLMSGEAIATAHFVEFVDKLFDSFNGFTEKGERGKELRCWLTKTSPHHRFWNEASCIIDSWEFQTSNSNQSLRPPSQDGWLTTINGFKQLWDIVSKIKKNWKTVDYLVPRTVNQDALENAFCSIRSHCGSNCNPNVSQFVGAFKTCIINGLAYQDVRRRGNCEEDGATLLSNLQTLLTCDVLDTSKSSPDNIDTSQTVVDKSAGDFDAPSQPVDLTSTAYVSGFIARRLLVNNACDGCRAGLLNTEPDELCFSGLFFKEYSDDKQKLTYPSLELVKSVGLSATLLEQMLEKQVHMNRVMETITSTIQQNVDFTWLKVNCAVHHEDVTLKIAKSICKIGIPWWCKKFNRALKENKLRFDYTPPIQ